MIQYSIDACANGKPIIGCCEPCGDIIQGKINDAETVTVPAGARYCFFDYGVTKNIFAAFDGTTAVRPAGVLASGSTYVNPKVVRVNNLSTFSILADGATYVSLRFYK